MRQTSGNQVGSENGSKMALQNLRPSKFCQICQLMFGSHERRVFLGDKTVHPHCALTADRSRPVRVNV